MLQVQVILQTDLLVVPTEEASSTTTGSITTGGGIGVAKQLFVGGNLTLRTF